jgi:Chromosome segregation ATPases
MSQAVQSKNYSYEENEIPAGEDDYGDFEQEMYDDPTGDAFMGEAMGNQDVSAKDLLAQLSDQAKSATLTPEQQEKILEDLHQLEVQLQKIGTVDNELEARLMETVEEKLNDIGENLIEGQSNYDKVNDFSKELQKLQAELKDNKYIPEKERKELEEKILEIQKQMIEDFSFDPADAKEEVDTIRSRVDATKEFQKEAERSQGVGQNIASAMDSVFLGMGAGGDISAPDAPWYDIRKQVFLDGFSYLTPVGEFVGGTLGFLTGFSTDGPSSSLKNSPKAVQNLDLMMRGQSKLGSTAAPGEIARILYNTELSPQEQIEGITKALGDLPKASQTYVLSILVKTISQQDPEKINFLKETAPEVAQFLGKEIRTGMDAINAGSLTNTGTGNYDVVFAGSVMHINNTDTAWYRDDWNDYDISLPEITTPMTEALNSLGESTAAPSRTTGSTPTP